jgi:hypothetical protein
MRIVQRALGVAAIILASFLALSCNNSYGIFKNIQDEQKQQGTSQFQETTAKNVFGLKHFYYAVTARLYRRGDGSDSAADTSWSQVNVGGLGSYTVYGAAASSSEVYALIWKDSTTNSTDAKSQNALYSSSDGINWQQPIVLPTATPPTGVTLSSSVTFQFESLFIANDQLFVVGHLYETSAGTSSTGTSTYYLYYLNDNTNTLTPVSNSAFFPTLPTTTKTIRGVVYDGSNYWFASEDQLYSGTLADMSNAASVIGTYTSPAALSGQTIWSLSAVSSSGPSSVYIGTKSGYLYQGGNATGIAVASVPLTAVVQVPSTSTSVNIILVGTDTDDVNTAAVGYFEGPFVSGELVSGASSHIVSNTSSVFNTTVSVFPVQAFYYDLALGNVFIAISPGYTSTSYYGLYESSWNTPTSPNAWTGWSAQ